MARSRSAPIESEFPSPRKTLTLTGQDAALAIAARAIRNGRPPQAWLVSGPPGVGKATFAFRIARYLLAHGARADGAEDLSLAGNDPVSLQVAAGAHPGLLLVQRTVNPETGKLRTEIVVDQIRKLSAFFGLTSGAGGWRIAIVDTADEMNPNAANALLKMLEEPPQRAMLLLLSNTPGKLLPTIRSRCQRLVLRPLDENILADALKQYLPQLNEEERLQLARLSGGSLGAALQLAGSEGVGLAAEAERLIENAREPDLVALMALGERLYRISDGVEKFGHFFADALAARIRARAEAGAPQLAAWTAALARLQEAFARAAGLNLEPRQTILSSARDLSRTARRAGAV